MIHQHYVFMKKQGLKTKGINTFMMKVFYRDRKLIAFGFKGDWLINENNIPIKLREWCK